MDAERLRYMAEQIARNFAVRGEEAAAAATAEHIRLFWDPRMIAQFVAEGAGASPTLARVIARLEATAT